MGRDTYPQRRSRACAFAALRGAPRASGHAWKCRWGAQECVRAGARGNAPGRASARRVRSGARGGAFGARQSVPRASGRTRERLWGAPGRAACERARTRTHDRCDG
eukprot:3517529-Pyramimonas_sp.AAC.1